MHDLIELEAIRCPAANGDAGVSRSSKVSDDLGDGIERLGDEKRCGAEEDDQHPQNNEAPRRLGFSIPGDNTLIGAAWPRMRQTYKANRDEKCPERGTETYPPQACQMPLRADLASLYKTHPFAKRLATEMFPKGFAPSLAQHIGLFDFRAVVEAGRFLGYRLCEVGNHFAFLKDGPAGVAGWHSSSRQAHSIVRSNPCDGGGISGLVLRMNRHSGCLGRN